MDGDQHGSQVPQFGDQAVQPGLVAHGSGKQGLPPWFRTNPNLWLWSQLVFGF